MELDKLHLVHPIDECASGLYYDYSKPNSPTILSIDSHSDAWYKNIGEVGLIKFKEARYTLGSVLKEHNYNRMGKEISIGFPFWSQGTDIPRCPKTNEVMQFVCMLPSLYNHKVINPEVYENEDRSNKYLHFFIDGHMYVFYSPKSKILYTTCQSG